MINSRSEALFLHTSTLLHRTWGEVSESNDDLDTILTEAALGRRRIWMSSLLFAEFRPSIFVPGSHASATDFARDLHALAVFVAPDPNIMLRAARFRDFPWQRPAALRRPDEQPRFMSLSDAIQIASALWVKEVVNVPELEFLVIDADSDDEDGERPLSLLRLQDFADDVPLDSDVMAAVRLTRAEPVLRSAPVREPLPVE